MRRKAMLWEKGEGSRVHCFLCAHHCKIAENNFGFCGMRRNDGGELFTYAYGRVIANQIDHVEKKPLYHFLPGTYVYSIAAIGCNFRCSFCQNWNISQLSVKDEDAWGSEISPSQIVEEAVRRDCRSIAYTYTEPTIFFEYAYDTARIAEGRGLYNSFVTNGYMTKEAIDMISPYLDAVNVDLKFFEDDSYKKICGGTLKPVLNSIRYMKKIGIWVEVTTLVIPGENDSDDELRGIARFIAATGRDIPWHISRFNPDYKFTDSVPTPIETMERASEIGKAEGLKYVYLGNVSCGGETFCPECRKLLIKREGFSAQVSGGLPECGKCGSYIPGVWG